MSLDALFRVLPPVVPIRAIHLDLKGVPPTPARLLELLRLSAAARYNAVLVEWEDTFPWTVDERFRSPTAYSADDVRRFCATADELGIEVISLVQCLGHMETPLSVPGYEHLREVPDSSDVLNPLALGACDLVRKMVDDVLTLTGPRRWFHLGGDEAWTFGTHPDTKAFVAAHGKGALYLRHVEPILAHLQARGFRPILWHDMMCEWDSAALHRLAPQADLMVWGYAGHPDTTPYHGNSRAIARYRQHGVTLWGAGAYKGGDGHNADLPDWPRREENMLAWADVAPRDALVGVVATAWSRYSTHRVQNEPIDGALDALVATGVILHDGRMPEGGLDACAKALDDVGEGARFRACHAALRALAEARREGWRAVQAAREQRVLERPDPRRRGTHMAARFLEDLRAQVRKAEAAGAALREALRGAIDERWVEEYLAERIDPLREEAQALA